MNRSFLVVEDNIDHFDLIEDALLKAYGEENIRITTTDLLDEGVAKLCRGDQFDVFLCDLTLTDSSLMNTVERLSQLETSTPIVVMTSLNDESLAVNLVNSGVQDYLPKNQISPSRIKNVCDFSVARKKILNQKQREAYRDELTRLLSKEYFENLLAKQIATAVRYQENLTLCYCKLDNHDQLLSMLGDQGRDAALVKLASVVKHYVHDNDLVARMKDDTLAISMHRKDIYTMKDSLSAIQRRLADGFEYEGRCCPLNLRFGVAKFEWHMNANLLQKKAEQALARTESGVLDMAFE